MPVIEHYGKLGKVAEVCSNYWMPCQGQTNLLQIDSSGTVQEIHKETCQWVQRIFSPALASVELV